MLYGINYRSFHTGLHGLLLYDNRTLAELAYEHLKQIEERRLDDEYYDILITDKFMYAYAVIEDGEINSRDIDRIMRDIRFSLNSNGIVATRVDDITVLNPQIAIDIY